MQFSRYIMQRTSLQMRLKDSNFNIFHPFLRNTDVISISLRFKLRSMRCTFSLRFKLRFARFHQVFLWKHHCFATLRKVYLFSNLRLRFRSSSLRKQCSGIHLLSHTVSSIVPSADRVLTIVFGMRTGVSPGRIDTAKF